MDVRAALTESLKSASKVRLTYEEAEKSWWGVNYPVSRMTETSRATAGAETLGEQASPRHPEMATVFKAISEDTYGCSEEFRGDAWT